MKTTVAGVAAAIGVALAAADLDGDPNVTTQAERYCQLAGAILGGISLVVLGKAATDAK